MKSQLCTYTTLSSPEFQTWATRLGSKDHMHRKVWEWCFICEALRDAGCLESGKLGLGFAVGQEPLVSVFNSFGVEVLATDLDTQAASDKGWVQTNQHAENKSSLNRRGLCQAESFDRLTTFEFADMTRIPPGYAGRFDFAWSACAFEHLGSLDAGIDFVFASLDTVKPGGVAVHTTEFNISSEHETVEFGETVIYRRKDIEKLVAALHASGYGVEVDWRYGDRPLDYFVDIAPYSHNPHLKLRLADYTVTSIGLVVSKPKI